MGKRRLDCLSCGQDRIQPTHNRFGERPKSVSGFATQQIHHLTVNRPMLPVKRRLPFGYMVQQDGKGLHKHCEQQQRSVETRIAELTLELLEQGL